MPHLTPTRAPARTNNGGQLSAPEVDPQDRIDSLLALLGTRAEGLTGREAQRRLDQFGPNAIIYVPPLQSIFHTAPSPQPAPVGAS